MNQPHSRSIVSRLLFSLFAILLTLSFCPLDTHAIAIHAQQTVRVGFFPLHGFYELDPQGKPYGYGVEYMDLLAQEVDWDYEFVFADTYEDALRLFREDQCDLLAPTPSFETFNGSDTLSRLPFFTSYGALMALETNESLIYEDFKGFSTLRIGVPETTDSKDVFLRYAKENGFTPNLIFYSDTSTLLEALYAGEIDAAATNLLEQKNGMKVLAKYSAVPFYFMAQSTHADVMRSLNIALERLKNKAPALEYELTQRYYPHFYDSPLTKKERDYVAAMEEPIRIGCRADFAPIGYTASGTGELAGISHDILDRISAISGLTFEYVQLPANNVTYDYLKEHNIRMVDCVEDNNQNASNRGMHMTTPYLNTSRIFVGKQGVSYRYDHTLKVAITTGSQTLLDVMKENYPAYVFVEYPTIEACCDAVLAGDADLLLHNRYVMERVLSASKYELLYILPTDGMLYGLCLSSVPGMDSYYDPLYADPRLISILNKSIAQIPQSAVEQFQVRHITTTSYQFTFSDFVHQYRYWLLILSFGFVLVTGLLGYIYSLRRKQLILIGSSERKLQHITNNINGGVVVLYPDKGLRITYANDGFLSLIHCSREEYEQRAQDYFAYVHPEDIPLLHNLVELSASENEKISVQLRIKQVDNGFVPTLFSGTIATHPNGKKEFYCVIMDISEQVHLVEQLKLEKKRTDVIIQKSGEIIFEINLQNHEIEISERMEQIFGWTFPPRYHSGDQKEIIEMWHIREQDRVELIRAVQSIFDTKSNTTCIVRILDMQDTATWCEVAQYPIFGTDGQIVSIVGRITNVNERMQEKEQLQQKAQTDPLTGLYNKEAFQDACRSFLNTNPSSDSALLFLDLDHFKSINDTFGHVLGDTAIRDAAQKLQVIFSNYDVIARFGGDEFCVFVKEIPLITLKDKLSWMLEKMRQLYEKDGQCVEITCSIGVSRVHEIGTDLDVLIDCADQALYRSKEKGRNCYTIYSSTSSA